jgi:hypothetical protein
MLSLWVHSCIWHLGGVISESDLECRQNQETVRILRATSSTSSVAALAPSPQHDTTSLPRTGFLTRGRSPGRTANSESSGENDHVSANGKPPRPFPPPKASHKYRTCNRTSPERPHTTHPAPNRHTTQARGTKYCAPRIPPALREPCGSVPRSLQAPPIVV